MVEQIALDSSTLLTWVLQERGWHAVDKLLFAPSVKPILPGPALTEVVSIARTKGNTATGQQMLDTFYGVGIEIALSTPEDMLRAAELLEVSAARLGPPNPRTGAAATLSLGDASILSVTERLGVRVVTRDGYWKWLSDQGLTTATVVAF
jgi:PIN domain nuclease of toxin-antitoxin system